MNTVKHRICFVISNIKLGGAERQFVKIINNLDRNIYHIDLLLYSFNGKIPFEINKNIIIKKINAESYSKLKIVKIFQSILILRKFFKKNKYDIIQTTLFINSCILRLSLPGQYNNKIIGTIRTTSYKWWQYLFEYFFIKNSYLITNSNYVYKKLSSISRFSKKINYVANGFEILDKEKSKSIGKQINIATVGRFSIEKNQIFLIKSFLKLNQQFNKLWLFGSVGNAYEKIKDFISKNRLKNSIELIIDENDPAQIYKNIDIFVLPSKYEGFPNTLYEAMISNKVCLISTNANLDCHIIDGHNGFVFNLNSVDDLVDKLNYVIKNINNDEINKIRLNAYNHVIKNYSIDKIANQYSNLYKKIISK